jgi:bifunctional DNA-binding transcriptional regulator/antitoxin component of YhaV-PrlF toxin-antitoxin module
MRLQKQLSRAVEGKEYPKYVLVVPPVTIEELQWKEGEELEHEVKDRTLLIRKAEPIDEEEVLRIARKSLRRKRR